MTIALIALGWRPAQQYHHFRCPIVCLLLATGMVHRYPIVESAHTESPTLSFSCWSFKRNENITIPFKGEVCCSQCTTLTEWSVILYPFYLTFPFLLNSNFILSNKRFYFRDKGINWVKYILKQWFCRQCYRSVSISCIQRIPYTSLLFEHVSLYHWQILLNLLAWYFPLFYMLW